MLRWAHQPAAFRVRAARSVRRGGGCMAARRSRAQRTKLLPNFRALPHCCAPTSFADDPSASHGFRRIVAGAPYLCSRRARASEPRDQTNDVKRRLKTNAQDAAAASSTPDLCKTACGSPRACVCASVRRRQLIADRPIDATAWPRIAGITTAAAAPRTLPERRDGVSCAHRPMQSGTASAHRMASRENRRLPEASLQSGRPSASSPACPRPQHGRKPPW